MSKKPRLEHGIQDVQHSRCISNGLITYFNYTWACVAYSKSYPGPENCHTPSDLILHLVLSPWQTQDKRSPTEQLTTSLFSLSQSSLHPASCSPRPHDIIRIIFVTLPSRLSELQSHFLFGFLPFSSLPCLPLPPSQHILLF